MIAATFDPGLTSVLSAAIATIGTVLVAYIGVKTRSVGEKADKIHQLVDGRMTQALDRIDQLEALLKHEPGIEVPPPAPNGLDL